MSEEEKPKVINEIETEAVVAEIIKPRAKKKTVELSPERLASREQAHAIKVAKFLSGGKF